MQSCVKRGENVMINIAVVGCGYWGPNLIRNFNSLDQACVKVVCDLDAKRLANMKRLYPDAETTSDFDRILQDDQIQAVVIAVPTKYHYEFGKRCLITGKHAFIEKPLASSVAECEELVQLSKQHNLILMVGHTFIYSSPVRMIKDIIDSGQLGQLQYVNSRRLNLGLFQKDINVTWDLAPHDISIILYVLNDSPSKNSSFEDRKSRFLTNAFKSRRTMKRSGNSSILIITAICISRI